MEVKRAHVHNTGWVEMECDRCSTRYSCLLDEWGHADTGFLGLAGIVPSDETMKEAAQYDLRATMKRSASRVPCPKCGAYGAAYVEALQLKTSRVVWWLAFLVAAAALIGINVAVWPDAPAWTVFIHIAAAWIAARIAGNMAAGKVDPNQDLEKNRKRALQGVAKGIVKVIPAGEGK